MTSYATKILNEKGDFVFMTPEQRSNLTNLEVEILKKNGKQLILVPDTVMNKVGDEITTFENVMENYKKSYEYSFVDVSDLSADEKRIFSTTTEIKEILHTRGYKVDIPVFISEKIRIDAFGEEAYGVYEPLEHRIIIKRKVLSNESKFCGTLAHELCHYQHGFDDNTRDFENDLTNALGDMIDCLLRTSAIPQESKQTKKKE